jgi:hypothetical protein
LRRIGIALAGGSALRIATKPRVTSSSLGLQFAPLAVLLLIRYLGAVARLRVARIGGRWLLGLLRTAALRLRMHPGRLTIARLRCGAGSRPAAVRPGKCVLR